MSAVAVTCNGSVRIKVSFICLRGVWSNRSPGPDWDERTGLFLYYLILCRAAAFPLVGTERRLPSDETYKSAQEFLEKMDDGQFDGSVTFNGSLTDELGKLPKEQLQELAHMLAERDQKRQ
jgi:hypothetical protein